jgi:AraC family transcriptional regulator, regulatory protein of adaptative response / methylated-DNA-[protein]-cysteine methyltransferase
MDLLTEEVMYEALVGNDSSFEGIFFAAIKTTGIFCRPSCTAKKPRKENVEFFKSAKEALMHGYRACKVCKPLEKKDATPDYIKEILNELSVDRTLKLKDKDLKNRGYDPNKIRRWFLKNHGLTFHAYQRMHRINTAFKKIKNGATVTEATFDSGYESMSGFNDAFRSVFGVPPSDIDGQEVVDITRLETPLGPMFACANKSGVCLLEFTDRKMLESEFKDLSTRLNATILQGKNSYFDQLKRELKEYFNGERKEFTVPLYTPGSEFQFKVWDQLKTIPYGETRSYKEQATSIGKPEAVRAVANANGMNRVAILIPCHRVIGSDGKLTGYGGGVWRKKYLLDLEKENK